MKITPVSPGAIDTYKNQNEQKKSERKNQTVQHQDRAEISTRGRELQTYRAMLKEMPGVRADRVEDIKNRLNNGTYEPSAEKIAEGIMREWQLETALQK